MYDTEKKYRQRISLGQSGNTLMTLIAITLILFVGLAFLKAYWYFKYSSSNELALSMYYKNVYGLFTLPATGKGLLSKPWTILTHMFVHDNIWRVFANMLWLWTFGYIMQDLTGTRKLAPVFIYGAIGGAIAFMLAYLYLPSLTSQAPFVSLSGAAAGVMAVAVATTLISPGYRIFPMLGGGIPLWILTCLYFASDLLTVSISDTGTIIVHLAGAFTGFLFIFFLRQGFDWSEGMSNFFEWVNNLFNPDKPSKNSDKNKELYYKATKEPFVKTPNLTQQRVDAILDKINQHGYNSLTEEEKELLSRASKQDI